MLGTVSKKKLLLHPKPNIMKKIILDTNFLMSAGEFDVVGELRRVCDFGYCLFVVDKTIEELRSLVSSTKDGMKAKLGLSFVENQEISVLETKKGVYADDEIVDVADEDTLVATMDKELKARLRKKGVQVIIIRQRKHLQIEGL